ncbi:MAG: phosphate ABC transporter permease subunit PstC [Alphaproteobacteria bacterium]|nr:phosphate ABC transporter permease subunit PstC [Alphaproteobacteria bacterium]
MQLIALVATLLLLSAVGFHLGRRRAAARSAAADRRPHSLPVYYGSYVALWSGLPALVVLLGWLAFEPLVVRSLVVDSLPLVARELPPERLGLLMNDVRNLAAGVVTSRDVDPEMAAAAETYLRLKRLGAVAVAVLSLAAAIGGLGLALRRVRPDLRARNAVERLVERLLIGASTIAIFTTVGIVLSLLFESIRFFNAVPIHHFLFGLEWSPQTAIRSDQVGSSGAFGAVPLFAGTFLISLIAMAVAMPVGLLSAIYMAEYAPRRMRAIIKPLLEVLAGIPTVVYGFFAALTVAPFLRDAGTMLGLGVSSESALAAGVVMGIMIIPYVSSIADDVITAVPRSLREASLGLGATRSETIRQVVVPAALPGIVGGLLLAVSRAIGETMIVVMAAGMAANLTANPFETVTTVTVQIVTLLVGDQEFDSPKTLAAFALGLVLFLVTLALNVAALQVVKRFREQYD